MTMSEILEVMRVSCRRDNLARLLIDVPPVGQRISHLSAFSGALVRCSGSYSVLQAGSFLREYLSG